LVVFVACPLFLFFFIPNIPIKVSAWAMKNYMVSFASLNGGLVKNLSDATIFSNIYSIAATRCISFAYTYHYFNWFSKIKVIKWGNIPKKRLVAMVLIWALSIVLYAYDFKAGLQALLTLSLLHVVLEFPLNLQSFKMIRSTSINQKNQK
jgi:hypothetical protein